MAKKKAKAAGKSRASSVRASAARASSGPAKARSKKPAAAQAPPSVASRLPVPTSAQIKAAQEKFEQGILARGEAVPAGQPLPPGATHEIVTPADGGPPVLKRNRYSLR
jgi:hypothetical protein